MTETPIYDMGNFKKMIVQGEVDRISLIAAIKQVLPVAKIMSYTISLKFDGSSIAVLAASTSEEAMGTARLVKPRSDASVYCLCINAQFLLDALNAISEPIIIWRSDDPNKAQWLNSDHLLMPILMPIRESEG